MPVAPIKEIHPKQVLAKTSLVLPSAWLVASEEPLTVTRFYIGVQVITVTPAKGESKNNPKLEEWLGEYSPAEGEMTNDTNHSKAGKEECVAASFRALQQLSERRDAPQPTTPPTDAREKAEAEASAAALKRDRERKETGASPTGEQPHTPTEPAPSSGEETKPVIKKAITNEDADPNRPTSGLEKLMDTKIESALTVAMHTMRNEIREESDAFASRIENIARGRATN